MLYRTHKFVALMAALLMAVVGLLPANAIIQDWETLNRIPDHTPPYNPPPPKPVAFFLYDSNVTTKEMTKGFESQKRNYKGFRFKRITADKRNELMQWYKDFGFLPAIDIRDGSGYMVASMPNIPELNSDQMHAIVEFFKPQLSDRRYFFASANKLSNDLGVLEPFLDSLAHAVYTDLGWLISDYGYKYTIILCADRKDTNLQTWRSALIDEQKKAELGKQPNAIFLDKAWKVHKKSLLRIGNASSEFGKPVDFATTRAFCFLVDKYGTLLAVLKDEEITRENIAQLVKQAQNEPVPRPRPPAN